MKVCNFVCVDILILLEEIEVMFIRPYAMKQRLCLCAVPRRLTGYHVNPCVLFDYVRVGTGCIRLDKVSDSKM